MLKVTFNHPLFVFELIGYAEPYVSIEERIEEVSCLNTSFSSNIEHFQGKNTRALQNWQKHASEWGRQQTRIANTTGQTTRQFTSAASHHVDY